MDSKGWYDIINCDKCLDGDWLKCYSTNEIVEFGVTIQAKNDDLLEAINKRILTLIGCCIPKIEQKEKDAIEQQRIKEQQYAEEQERQRIKKKTRRRTY